MEEEPPSSVVSMFCGVFTGETVGEDVLVRDDLIVFLSSGLVVLGVTDVAGLGCKPFEDDDNSSNQIINDFHHYLDLATISSRLISDWISWTNCCWNRLITESHLTNIDSLRCHWICELNEVTHCATHGDLYGNVDPSEGHTVLHGNSQSHTTNTL